MTANQIAYYKAKEDKRSHQKSEKLTEYANQSGRLTALSTWRQAEVAAQRAQEEQRHNQETERFNWWSAQGQLAESQRSHREQERIADFSANALARYQERQAATSERSAAVQERNAATQERQATVSERQTTVSERQAAVQEHQLGINQYDAYSRRISAQADATKASAAVKQAQVAESGLAESIRHNYAAEQIQRSYNKAYIEERERASRQAESAKRTENRTKQQAQDLAERQFAFNRGITTFNTGVNAVEKSAESFRDITLGVSSLAKTFTLGGLS